METSKVDQTKRIFLWSVSRSLSLAFCATMYNRPNTLDFDSRTAIYIQCMAAIGSMIGQPFDIQGGGGEPYDQPFHIGPDRPPKKYTDPPVEKFTYSNITQQLENAPLGESTFSNITQKREITKTDIDVVFVKDMAYHLVETFGSESLQHLPENFAHSFLVRTPYKSIPSLHKASVGDDIKEFNMVYKTLYELYLMVKEKYGTEPVVIDSDDLEYDPEGILRAYCDRMGIAYHKFMLDWQHHPGSMKIGFDEGWFRNLYQSKTITKKTVTELNTESIVEQLPHFAKQQIIDALPYYLKLKEKCLKIK